MASSLRRSSFDCVCALTIFAVVLVAPLQAAAAEAAGGSARKLLQTTMTSDYTAFCSPPRGYSGNFAPGLLAHFNTESDVLWNIDVCGLATPITVSLAGEPVFKTSIAGTFTQTLIPGGRRLSLAVTGSNVFFAGSDEGLNYIVSNSTLPGERFLGVGPVGEGFTVYKPALSLGDLQLVIGVATSFNYSLTWEVRDGSTFGTYNNLTYKDIVYNPSKATFISEEAYFTATGPLRSTSILKYPLGQFALVSVHQASAADKGGKNNPYVSDTSFDMLAPDARSARAEQLMVQVIPSNLLVATVSKQPLYIPTVLPAGGTCDAYGNSPFQCYASNGQSYVCCPGPCPNAAQGLIPSCV